ncbi:MAG: hypothetical protein WEB58_16485 [Planctomycetaceae bacterium]
MIDSSELRKQISIFVPLSDWRAIREEAARRGIPMTELCRRWMAGDLKRLRIERDSTFSRDAAREKTDPR